MSEFFVIEKAAEDRITVEQPTKQTKGILYPLHDFRASIDVIGKNIYAKRCLDEIYKTTVGKGFEMIPVDFKAVLTQNYLERIDKDYLKTGNSFTEVKTLNGKIIALYHVPVLTMAKMADGKFTQPTVKNSKILDSFDDWTGTETGEKSFILHIMDYEDDENYGCPFWLSAEYKITQSTNADVFNANFFKNDCKPEGVILGKGINFTTDEKNAFKDALKNGFKGVANSRKNMVVFSDTLDGNLEYIKFGDSIIDMSFINLTRDNKTDICAAFRVPPKLVGLETPGKLGGGNDFAQQVNIFYQNEIIPRQVFYEEIFSRMAGSEVRFVRPVMMAETTAQPVTEPTTTDVQKNAREDAVLEILRVIADKII